MHCSPGRSVGANWGPTFFTPRWNVPPGGAAPRNGASGLLFIGVLSGTMRRGRGTAPLLLPSKIALILQDLGCNLHEFHLSRSLAERKGKGPPFSHSNGPKRYYQGQLNGTPRFPVTDSRPRVWLRQ